MVGVGEGVVGAEMCGSVLCNIIVGKYKCKNDCAERQLINGLVELIGGTKFP